MINQNRNIIQATVYSTILIIIPMFVFPTRLGLGLGSGSLVYSMFEIVFYGLVFYFMRPDSSLVHLLAGAGMTFIYRLIIGSIFGLLLSLSYGMDLTVSLSLGISKYLPAILFHVAGAPFIMRPFFLSIADDQTTPARRTLSRPTPHQAVSQREKEAVMAPVLPESDRPAIISRVKTGSTAGNIDTPHATAVSFDTNGFERAVKYLGEHHAVLLAAVVDHEGLTLAAFKRGPENIERWTSYSLLFQKANEDLLHKNNQNDCLDHLDLTFGTNRLSIIRTGSFNLLVLSDSEQDDLLSIRVTQAADIIRKYTSERYGKLLLAETEEQYVSNS